MDRRRSSILIPEIYKATINPEHWKNVMELIAGLTESRAACLYFQDKNLGLANTIAQFGCTTSLFTDIRHQFAILDTLFDKSISSNIKEDILYQIFPPDHDSFKNLEPDLCENYVISSGNYRIGRVQFLDSNLQRAAIAIFRDEESGPWQKGDIRIIQEIIPHIKRALDIHAEFTRLRVQQDALVMGLDRLVIGLLLCDQNSRIVYINPTAKAIIEAHPALALGEEGLSLYHADDDKNLHSTIRNIALNDSEDSWKQSVAIAVTHPDVDAPLPLLVTPIHAQMLTSNLDYEGAQVAVFLSDPNSKQPISVNNLVSVYGLTPSEAQVAISIANGSSIATIAETTNHSAHTIRSQLKSTFRKTGVSRQSELIKLLLTGPFAHRRRSNIQ